MDRSMKMHLRALVIVLLVLSAPRIAQADEWPQWRGLNRDGVWKETGLIEKFPATQLKTLWRVPISAGYSGPTVARGRVYVMDRIDMPKQVERVLAFGRRRLVFRADSHYASRQAGAGVLDGAQRRGP
jgi:outer membrane protein assembly factor BamB